MPSPFPGRDPFLEHPDFFPDLHGAMHVYIRETLQRSLPAPYFAVINERLVFETTHDEHREPYVEIRTRLAEGCERIVAAGRPAARDRHPAVAERRRDPVGPASRVEPLLRDRPVSAARRTTRFISRPHIKNL